MMITEPAKVALKRRNPAAKWATASERMGYSGFPIPRQNFRLPANATVFTIGSCFARNIEEHLALIGCQVPTLAFSVPKSEWRARPNGILNKYTPAAIYQEIDWARRCLHAGSVTRELCNEMRWDLSDGQVIDLQLGGNVPVSEERFLERRSQVYELFKQAFTSDCVTITLGLVEAWRDIRTGLFVQSAPVARALLRETKNFEFVLLDYQRCVDYISRTIEIIREFNPVARILVTTSPVPMEKTFTDEDVIIANMTSKSILRSVAHQVTNLGEGIDYFPSYEAVMMSDRSDVFKDDNLHVRDSFVGKIVQNLVTCYFEASDDVSSSVQRAASELEAQSEDYEASRDLVDSDVTFDQLTTDQLVIYLRVCWRLRRRAQARHAAEIIMQRRERSARHIAAVKHIFPRIGLVEDAKRYASELLALDSSNPLARELLQS